MNFDIIYYLQKTKLVGTYLKRFTYTTIDKVYIDGSCEVLHIEDRWIHFFPNISCNQEISRPIRNAYIEIGFYMH